MTSLTPPTYVNVPIAIAYAAGVDDALVVTMARILGLCWDHGYRHTAPLTPAELMEATGRPHATFYRHLRLLQGELHWLRVDRVGSGHLVLHSLVGGPSEPPPAPEVIRQQRLCALAEAGIERPVRDSLASDPGVDPLWISAWHLWTRHPSRSNLKNPAGVIVGKLRDHEPPPDEYLQLASLTVDEREQLRASYWIGADSLDSRLRQLRPFFFLIYGDPRG
jgi:hypothetical protein